MLGGRSWHKEETKYDKGTSITIPFDEAKKLGSSVQIIEEIVDNVPFPDMSVRAAHDEIRNTDDINILDGFYTAEKTGQNRKSIMDVLNKKRRKLKM